MTKSNMSPLVDLFFYSEEGNLIWRHRPLEHFATHNAFATWNSRFAGRVVGSATTKGYIKAEIGTPPNRSVHMVHRLIWEFHNGPIPADKQIDHVNGIKNDNRIENLRLASASENKANIGPMAKSRSGLKGAHFHRQTQKWTAMIRFKETRKYLGYFNTAEEAHLAYCKAAAELHGDFARTK